MAVGTLGLWHQLATPCNGVTVRLGAQKVLLNGLPFNWAFCIANLVVAGWWHKPVILLSSIKYMLLQSS